MSQTTASKRSQRRTVRLMRTYRASAEDGVPSGTHCSFHIFVVNGGSEIDFRRIATSSNVSYSPGVLVNTMLDRVRFSFQKAGC